MILGIFLSLGESLSDLEKNGKLARFRDYYLPAYQKRFEKIYIFSYGIDKNIDLPKGCFLVPNKWNLHRYLYTFFLPFINTKHFSKLKVSRVMQLSGIIPALIVKLFWRNKIIVTYGYDYRFVEKLTGHPFKSFLYLLIEKAILPMVDTVIFSSKTILSTVGLSNGKSIYLPNGIDISKFKPNRTKATGDFSILVQARLSPEKNLENLIKAVSEVDGKINLIIIGFGPLKDSLYKLSKNFRVNLEIIEKVPYDQMPYYFNRVDIYVHPSITEGSPKALIEAACCGCCILATDIPQNREILGGDAFYFKLGAVDLAAKLKFLYKNPKLREEYRNRIRKTVEKDFDIKKLLRRETQLLSGDTPH